MDENDRQSTRDDNITRVVAPSAGESATETRPERTLEAKAEDVADEVLSGLCRCAISALKLCLHHPATASHVRSTS